MADDDIDWSAASANWLGRVEAEKEAKRANREAPIETFASERGSELACARAELFNAITDCIDLGYLPRNHVTPFLARRLQRNRNQVSIGMLDLETCEKAVREVNRYLDRKLAVEAILGPPED